jgi:type VI protein secretion system component Hcp
MAMYLDIVQPSGIVGESKSQNPAWNNKIEIETLNWSVSQSTSQGRGRGLVSNGAKVGHLSITKVMDKATPLLWYYLSAGMPIDQMFIRVNRTGAAGGSWGGLFEAETKEYDNVIVSSYTTSGSPGSAGLPSEHWTFSCTKVKLTTVTVDPTGKLLPAKTQGYDFSQGTPF